MSLHATPLLYLNLGGEMLYVLRQRLKAQRIDVHKTIQVLDDVTAALVNPKVLSWVFKESTLTRMPSLRSTLETVALSSIMRLDTNSMDKLFDLMIMMVKYQLMACTGPREVILMTLNHTDAMKDMVSDPNARECVALVHQMVVDFYCNLTFEEVWSARCECVKELAPYCVRVSILLRLGLQNEDTSFNLTAQKYDERYDERRDVLADLKIKDVEPDRCGGSFHICGDRATLLGKNMYSPTYGMTTKLQPKCCNQNFLKDCGAKAELGMLAVQLGTEEPTSQRPFTLNLFTNEDDDNSVARKCNRNVDNSKSADGDAKKESMNLNEDYKNKLDNVYADFFEDESSEAKRNVNLLDLLDAIE